MKFSKVVETYEQLEKISSGNKMREVLAKLLKKASSSETKNIAYLTLGQIGSSYEDIVIGMADKMVLKSIAQAGKIELSEVVDFYMTSGDVGRTAEAVIKESKPKLQVNDVMSTLRKIAEMKGKGSQERKIEALARLFDNATTKESKYIGRIVMGQLRLGAGDKTILDALSISKTGTKESKKALEHAYQICPDVGLIAETFKEKGTKGLDKISVAIGRPVQMMLCQRIDSLNDVENKMNYPVAVENKYDGERIQVHKNNSQVVLFSRRLDNITDQFPDLVRLIKKHVTAKKCIIECEACPVDKKGNLLKFQVLMQRRRKHKVEEYIKKIPVCFFFFDVLYYNKSLIHKSYADRYKTLKKILKPNKYIKFAERKVCKDVDCVDEMFQKIISDGGEGIVIKSLDKDSSYQAGVRGWHWIKWKPEYAKGLRDTFDLAVVGAYAGRGKRAGSYGALLCAAYNKKKDQFETFCKVGSGFTDKLLSDMQKKFKKYESKKKPARVVAAKSMFPPVWFKPGIVIEVTGGEITKSPNHTCGKSKGQGYALRFPRFLRYRDKKPEDSTSVKEIIKMV